MYKYIILDMDGTLLNSKKEISEQDKNVVCQLKDEGIRIVLASGRHFHEMQRYFKELHLEDNDYVICCDGQYIYNVAGKQVWNACFLTPQDIDDITTRVDNINTSLLIVTDQKNYLLVESFASRVYCLAKNLFRRWKNIKIINGAKAGKVTRIEKIKINCNNINHAVAAALSEYYNVNEIEGSYELLHKNVSKYSALCKLQRLEYIDLDDAVYIGDDYNDKECFGNLKHCVAMENAPVEVRSMAMFVTENNDNLGVSVALKKIFEVEE
ncbi:MAG: Cof-type HAD-IIB family hydrolase [Sedimentibacter saalensis]|uniref:HAD family hydrolase n=1 Tax=Sedimentibacter saalensis TaxID=130788 RepID=UPI002B206B46|nr:Cof-type HAD-IIB family hydrolase [Sedimentibacter saalensis]MEA5093492.1 Cof-type HAD-IIB family hydrolase [Sedimentibacter saalensis]